MWKIVQQSGQTMFRFGMNVWRLAAGYFAEEMLKKSMPYFFILL
jgi:hypothetical protein